MSTFYISDTHAYHKNIITYCSRPFTNTNEMNKHIISSWNSVVTNKDTVIFGGDFAFASLSVQRDFLKCLNGSIYCVKGNHDRSKNALLKIGFKAVYDRYEDDQVIVKHKPEDFLEEEINSKKYCLYGHTHNDYHRWLKANMFCICVEPLNYTPRTLDQLKELYEKVQILLPLQQERKKDDNSF